MKVLALVDAPDHVCCRYRIRAFEPALNRAGWSIDYLGLDRRLLGRIAQLTRLPRYDTIILQRKLLPHWQLDVLRRKARRLVFDFDDAVLYRDSYDPRGPFSPRREHRFAATVRLADTVTAGNDFLADCALRAGALPERVRVLPTCLATERYYPAAEPAAAGLNLVWIGSSSTLQGLEAQGPLWDRIAGALPGLRMRVICDRFPEFSVMPVVKVVWSEATEAQALAEGGVGISWVPDDLWSRGKCGLKVLQYQAAGLPVLANPVGVHAAMITPGVDGWLPCSSTDWVDAVRALAADARLRARMGRSARASIEANYSVAAWESTFVSAISGASAWPSAASETVAEAHPRVPAGIGPIGAKG